MHVLTAHTRALFLGSINVKYFILCTVCLYYTVCVSNGKMYRDLAGANCSRNNYLFSSTIQESP